MTGNNPKAYLILKCPRNATFHPFVDTTCNLKSCPTQTKDKEKRELSQDQNK